MFNTPYFIVETISCERVFKTPLFNCFN